MRPRHLSPLASILLAALSACGPCAPAPSEIPDEKPALVAPEPAVPEPERAFAITSTEGLPAELIGGRPVWDVATAPGTVGGRPIPAQGERLYPDGRMFQFRTTWSARPCTLSAASVAEVEAAIRAEIARGSSLKPTDEATPWIDPPEGSWVVTHRAWVDGAETMFVMTWNGDENLLPTHRIDGAIAKGTKAARDAGGC